MRGQSRCRPTPPGVGSVDHAEDQIRGERVPRPQAGRRHRGFEGTENHTSNAVYQRLRERGYEVFAVNPNSDEVEGDQCYHDLATIPGSVEGVMIATRPETAESDA